MEILKDPLDSPSFDPVDFINSRFSTEASLEDLDTFTLNISSQISALDDEISQTVQSQSSAGIQAKRDIYDAKRSITDLFDIVLQIRSKASASEQTVQELCADIRKLDCAKTHLQATITSLKRLQMLITAVNQLESWKELPLKQVADMLEAVKQLMTHFDMYTYIPKINEITSSVKEIEISLSTFTKERFCEVGQLVDSIADASEFIGKDSLTDICLVVNALGSTVSEEIVNEFVNLQLAPYDTLFGQSNKENFTLENVERRWPWFKRVVRTIDSKFSTIIPPKWNMLRALCVNFCKITREHILVLLRNSSAAHPSDLSSSSAAAGAASSSSSSFASSSSSGGGAVALAEAGGSVDVSSLLKALQTTLRFEEEMSKRFESSSNYNQQGGLIQLSLLGTGNSSDGKSANKPNHSNDANSDSKFDKIIGSISSHYDGFLRPYVLLERGNLAEMLQRITREEEAAIEALARAAGSESVDEGFVVTREVVNEAGVLHSSTSMFVFIKNMITRCTTLTTGQTFLLLSKEFKVTLLGYIDWLAKKLPLPVTNSSTHSAIYHLKGLMSCQELCHVVNTCEYCAEVAPTLASMIKAKIDIKYRDDVELEQETEAFLDLSARAAKALVGGLVGLLEPGFKQMISVNWSTLADVGEESSYLYRWQAVILEMIPAVRIALSGVYFKNLCTKVASEILSRYLDVIIHQKRISEFGTQQLLLDTHFIKTLLLKLHGLVSTSGFSNPEQSSSIISPPQMYIRLVTSRCTHIEAVLKLIGTSEDMIAERFKTMWPEGTVSDFQNLLNMKGTRRSDQHRLIESLGPSVRSGDIGSGTGGISPQLTTSSSSVTNAMRSLTSLVI